MSLFSSSKFSRRPGATLAGIFSIAVGSVLLLCGAGSVPIENLLPQGAMQGDLNAGNHSITNAATVSATNFVGPATGLTGLNPTGISTPASGILMAYHFVPDGGLESGAEFGALSYSVDGANFQPCGNLESYKPPANGSGTPVGVRDVSIVKSGGLFIILYHAAGTTGNATQTATSTDLCQWTYVTSIGFANNAKMFWDGGGLYAVGGVGPIYISQNTDLVGATWSSLTQVTLSGGGSFPNLLDPCMIIVSGTYYIFAADEADSGYFHYWTSTSRTSGYTDQGRVSGWGAGEGTEIIQDANGVFHAYWHSSSAGQEVYATATSFPTTWTTPANLTGQSRVWDNQGGIAINDQATLNLVMKSQAGSNKSNRAINSPFFPAWLQAYQVPAYPTLFNIRCQDAYMPTPLVTGTGTITITGTSGNTGTVGDGSTGNVAGTGTKFLNELSPGDTIYPSGDGPIHVVRVYSNTSAFCEGSGMSYSVSGNTFTIGHPPILILGNNNNYNAGNGTAAFMDTDGNFCVYGSTIWGQSGGNCNEWQTYNSYQTAGDFTIVERHHFNSYHNAFTLNSTTAGGGASILYGTFTAPTLAQGSVTSAMLKANSSGTLVNATAGTDYSLITVQTGTLSSGTATATVPSGCHPWVQDTASSPSGPMSVTVSGTTATIHGTGSDAFTLFNAASQ